MKTYFLLFSAANRSVPTVMKPSIPTNYTRLNMIDSSIPMKALVLTIVSIDLVETACPSKSEKFCRILRGKVDVYLLDHRCLKLAI